MPGKSYYGLFCLLPLLLFTALPATGQPSPGDCEIGEAAADLDVNNVRAWLFNTGNLFWRGSGNVYNVPKGGEAHSIFNTGIWIGGLVNGELRFAGTAYGPYSYWPGPLDEEGNPPDDCSAYDRIYKVSRADFAHYDQTGQASPDLRDWPWQLGAPVEDGDGIEGNYDLAAGDRPKLYGDQTLWWVMNDAGGIKEWSQTDPIGLEVQVTAYAYATNDALDNTTFYRYKLINKGSEPFEKAYFGIWTDPDLGNAANDFVGSDTTLDMGFVYNGTDIDPGVDGYGNTPPALGYTFLQGPTASSDNKDNDRDGEVDEANERHGMSVFLNYSSGGPANGNPTGPSDDPYQYLQGLWRDGSPMTYGGYGLGGTQPTSYMYSGDPVQREYWSEENTDGAGSRNTPADRRFLMSSGPFLLQPGESDEIAFAIVWSRSFNRLLSVTALREDTRFVRAVYNDESYVPPMRPPVPLAPALIAPFDNATNVDTRTHFSWRPSEHAEMYQFQLATDPGFENPRVSETYVDETETEFVLANNTTYYWRVLAANWGSPSLWSPTYSFTTGTTRQPGPSYKSFETVANAAGPLDPITGAAADFAGFPVPERPDDRQQVAEGIWFIGTGDNGARGSFEAFTSRTTNGNFDSRVIHPYDFEIRFTDKGSIGYDPFCTGLTMDVPFELWRIGIGTPDDPSDDVRMVPYLLDNDFSGVFDLNSTPSIAAGGGACAGQADHTVSSAENDPQTDWIYWATPTDDAPGEAGYRAWERAAVALDGGDDGSFYGTLASDNAIRRIVLVNWNGGDVNEGVYNQAMPETGTIFRIRTYDPLSLTFEASLTGINNLPAVTTSATGSATLTGEPRAMTLEGSFSGLRGEFLSAVLYEGYTDEDLNAPFPPDSLHLQVDLAADRRSGSLYVTDSTFFIDSDAWFVVIKSTAFPEGELRGQLLPTPNAAPTAPRLRSPSDGSLVRVWGPKNQPFEVTWDRAGDPNANRLVYRWQLASDPAFSDLLINAATGTDVHYETPLRHIAYVLEAAGIGENSGATLYHRVIASDGSLFASSDIESLRFVRGTLTATEQADLPERFALLGNYPNPFNPTTTVRFDLPQAAEVTLTVYDVLGRKVMTVGGQTLAAGAGRQLQVDGSRLASGLYLYRIEAKALQVTWQDTGRFVLVK